MATIIINPKPNEAVEKIRIAMIKNNNMKSSDLAKSLDVSVSNLCNKLKRNNLTETEIRRIANAIGYEVEINFISFDGQDKI